MVAFMAFHFLFDLISYLFFLCLSRHIHEKLPVDDEFFATGKDDVKMRHNLT